MTKTTENRYVLEAIDPETASISHDVSFEVTSVAELCEILGINREDFNPDASYPLEDSIVSKLQHRFGLMFDHAGHDVWLRLRHGGDDRPYKTHTGRELAMMLAGTKPLASFIDDYPKHHDLDIIPEREFEPHVISGRIIKREKVLPPGANAPVINGQPIGSRRVLYALPGEEWRIDAYLQLWETSKKTGWTAALEREEGTLLGYEEWQNDIHMKGNWRPPPQIPNS